MSNLIQDNNYKKFIAEIKQNIQSAQIKAAVSVNRELLKLYWFMGEQIVEKQKTAKWGDGFLKQLSQDLKQEFPDMKGFSYRNMRNIKQWYLFWIEQDTISQQLVGKLKDKKNTIRQQAVAKITKQAVSQLENQKGQQVVAKLEDAPIFQIPLGHNLVIISKTKSAEEALFYANKTIENNWSRNVLIHQIESDLYIRTGKFKPEYAGKLNFYVSAIDAELKTKQDNPTIGILICKEKKKTIIEYALKDISKPIGVSEYQLTKQLPDNFKGSLPSIEEIEKNLNDDLKRY